MLTLKGPGTFDVEIKGESHYQDNLLAIHGPKRGKSAQLKTTATLIAEDDNPHDDNAVRVEIAGPRLWGIWTALRHPDSGPICKAKRQTAPNARR